MIHKRKLVLLATVLSFGAPSMAPALDLGLDNVLDLEETLDLDEVLDLDETLDLDDTVDDVVETVGGVADDLDLEIVEIDVTDAALEIVERGDNAVNALLDLDVDGAVNEVEEIIADVSISTTNGLGVGLGGDEDDDIFLNVPGLPGLPLPPGGGGGQGPGGGGGNGGNGGTVVVNVPGSRTIIRGGGGGGGGGGAGMSAYQQLLARFNAMTTPQRAQLIAQCLAVLANPRQYGSDQVQLCQMVAQIPGIMGYLNVATR
ncbi:MAG: hypothetical protein IT535_09255 [Bauldia sp.]|nr:hypothetical protein [Bauldia sp.]